MKVEPINKTTFGLRKLTTLHELGKQKGIKISPLESSSVNGYREYMKKAVENMKKNAARAIESAKKIFIK